MKFWDSMAIFKGWFWTWESQFLTWKSGLRGRGHSLGACLLLLRPSNVPFLLKEKVLMWKFDLMGATGTLVCLSSPLGDLQMVPSRWKRRSWLGPLIFEVKGTFICLVSSLKIFNLSSLFLEEKVSILKAFFLERESLMWGRALMWKPLWETWRPWEESW